MDCNIIYGEKEPYEDKSHTHGLCPKCFKIRMEKIEKMRKSKEAERGLTNVPNGNGYARIKPKKGDFVLAFDDIWIIQKIERKIAHIENVASGDYEKLYIGAFEFTPIHTWEIQ